MRRGLSLGITLLATMGLTHGAALAQPDSLRIDDVNDDAYPFVDVTVTVPAALEDVRLPKEAFAVTEDGERRPRPTLGNTPEEDQQLESVPPSAVLVVDVSGSMSGAIGQARDAAERFVQSLPRDSQVAIVTFGDDVDVALDFTSDVELMRASIRDITVDPSAQTALYDGVRRAADLLPTRAGAPASIILLSDGGDTVSETGEAEAVRHLRDRKATLWAVSLDGSEPDPEALDALAGRTGEVLDAANADELDGIYQELASDLSRRYLLRYESAASGETAIGVTVDHDPVIAHSSFDADLAGAPAAAGSDPAPVAAPQVFTVTLPPLGTTAAFAAGIAAVALGSLLLWLMILAPRSPLTRERLGDQGNRTRPRLSGLAEWTTDLADRSLRDRTIGRRLDRYLEGAGLDLRPGEVAVIIVSTMVVAFTVGVVIGGGLLGVMLAAVPPLVTRLVLSIRRDRRQAAFSDQLTDVLQLISGSLRAGYGLLQGIDAVGRDADEPAAAEFRRILIEHRLGRDLNDAMQTCAERMGNADFAWVVQAIGIHREVGGDLARVLDNITATVRDRGEVHRQVRALSAEGRMSASVLTGLPIVVLVVIQVMSPDYMTELLARPIGWVLLSTAAVLLLTGAVWIRRMVRIKY